MQNFCVYCSSRAQLPPVYLEAAIAIGEQIGRRGGKLIYGGCSVGLMKILADATRDSGGRVIGVLPQFLHEQGIGDSTADELIITPGMRERKAAMEDRADAFLVLPGGFGTLEEFFEILTLKQLNYHSKPIVLLNVFGFYDPLVDLFEHIYRANFARAVYRDLYYVSDTVEAAFTYIDTYRPPELGSKWSG